MISIYLASTKCNDDIFTLKPLYNVINQRYIQLIGTRNDLTNPTS